MQYMLLITISLFTILAIGLSVWRSIDHLQDRSEIDQLLAYQPIELRYYQPEMVANAPLAVQRFFNFAISPGTPLLSVAMVEMHGQFSMGNKEQQKTIGFEATQVIAFPHGFVWKMKGGSGLIMRISGSDSAQWTRFWINELLPVARAGGDADHRQSAFGRYVCEALFWSPASLLPGKGIAWSQLSENTVRVEVEYNNMSQMVELTIDETGRPLQVVFPRWSNANKAKEFQLQPFGGTLSAFREFSGYRLPTVVEAGNFFGTNDYFPFFKAEVTEITFPLQPNY